MFCVLSDFGRNVTKSVGVVQVQGMKRVQIPAREGGVFGDGVLEV